MGCSVEVSRETSPTEDGVPPAEEATEATEANAGVGDEEEDQGVDLNQPGIYTEHVFTDPLGVEPSDPSQSASKYFLKFYTFSAPSLAPHNLIKWTCWVFNFFYHIILVSRQDVVTSLPEDSKQPSEGEIQRMSSALPTMWLGAQNGWWAAYHPLDGALSI